MIFPQSEIAGVCRTGPVQAAAMLELARGGDLYALAAVVVRGTYKHLVKLGASPVAAMHHTHVLYSNIELNPKVGL